MKDDDNAPRSMDEVLAQAARLGREARRDWATRASDAGAVDMSLAAIAHHARQEAAALSAHMPVAPGTSETPRQAARPNGVPSMSTSPAAVTDMSEVIAATHHQSAEPSLSAPTPVVDVRAALRDAVARGASTVTTTVRRGVDAAVFTARHGADVLVSYARRGADLVLCATRQCAETAVPAVWRGADAVMASARRSANTVVATARAGANKAMGTVRRAELRWTRTGIVATTAVLVLGSALALALALAFAFQRQSFLQASRSPVAGQSPAPAPTPVPAPVLLAQAKPLPAEQAQPVPVQAATPVVAAPVPGPSIGVVVDQSDAGNRTATEQLAAEFRKSGTLVATDLQANGWLAGLAALATQPRIAVVRYDALQAARSAPAAARIPPLEIVAPLQLEPIYFVVRADSPLQFIHQIRGKAINTGAANSTRALTANAVYRGMFNAVPPASKLRAQDESAALQSLANGQLDVLVLVGSAATAWFDTSGEAAFKLLALDPNQPQASKALDSYLPVMAGARSLGVFPANATQTLAVMSFVVTSKMPAGDAVEHDAAIARVAQSLCGGGQAVDPTLQLPVGWPYSDAAQTAFKRCAGKAGTAARAVATAPGTS